MTKTANGFHLTYDLLLLVLRGDLPAGLVDQQTRLHLVDLCDICRNEWRRSLELTDEISRPFERQPRVPEFPRDPLRVGFEELAASEQQQARMKKVARLARSDLSRLLRLPVERWSNRVANARTRFQSRAFAWLLVQEADRRLQSSPQLAKALAALVPEVLARRPGRESVAWAQELRAQASARVTLADKATQVS